MHAKDTENSSKEVFTGQVVERAWKRCGGDGVYEEGLTKIISRQDWLAWVEKDTGGRNKAWNIGDEDATGIVDIFQLLECLARVTGWQKWSWQHKGAHALCKHNWQQFSFDQTARRRVQLFSGLGWLDSWKQLVNFFKGTYSAGDAVLRFWNNCIQKMRQIFKELRAKQLGEDSVIFKGVHSADFCQEMALMVPCFSFAQRIIQYKMTLLQLWKGWHSSWYTRNDFICILPHYLLFDDAKYKENSFLANYTLCFIVMASSAWHSWKSRFF